ncbi:fimbria/pilus periplasmic chaperone [Aliivibrio sifiae]|uniref:fimbria/pilus periplasmic chaperone n=1 Tax=Aliivibrio sifiae TaxID=566293 RepID=UPI003D10864C
MKKQCYAFLFIVLCSFQVSSFELFPMVNFFSDSGKSTSGFFKITNTSLQQLPVEIVVNQRLISGDQPEELTNTDDIFVFPPQAMIAPGASQTIRVQYVGSAKKFAESYRLIVSQLPLKDDMGDDSIQMLFRIGGLIFVSPHNAEEKIASRILLNEKEEPVLKIDNLGNSVIEVSKHSFKNKWQDNSYTWKWEQIEPFIPLHYLVPGQNVSVPVTELVEK